MGNILSKIDDGTSQMAIYYICVLKTYLTSSYPKEIIMLIISMMIDNNKVICGSGCTTFIINNSIYKCGCNNLIPTKQLFTETQIDSIYYRRDHTILIEKSKKEIYSMGLNDSGQLGLGDNNPHLYAPQKIMFDFGSKITSISCSIHTLIVTELGTIYGWGHNYSGQLGLGDNTNHNFPHKVPIENVKDVKCSNLHTVILTSDGCGYSCGKNSNGQLGLGDYKDRNSIQKIDLSNIRAISCGGDYTIALTLDGTYSWGGNSAGQLGLGDRLDRCIPQKIDLLDSHPVAVSCGLYHTMILTSEGKLFVCGNNWNGQLGLGHKVDLCRFQLLNFNEIILSVDCGWYHTIITTSRKYYGCGHNSEGQLGLGDTNHRYVPTAIVIKDI